MVLFGLVSFSLLPSHSSTHLSTSASQTFPSHLMAPYVYKLKASKTDPYYQGYSILLAPFGSSVCAICTPFKYLALLSSSTVALLYVFHYGLFLTRAKVTSVLRLLLQHTGVSTEHYASYTFWIGQLYQQLEQVYLHGLFRNWGTGPATALHFTSELLLFFTKYPASWTLLPGNRIIWHPCDGRYTPAPM